MHWNWQDPDWPNFTWAGDRLAKAEALFLEGAGVVVGASKFFSAEARQDIGVEILSGEAIDTSAIEGEHLDRASVQSSIRRHLGLKTDLRRAHAAEAGIAEMMVDLFGNLPKPLDKEALFRWHALLMNGRRDIREVGTYRTHDDPMQIVSGPIHAPRVHFEAPPSAHVPREMDNFFSWLERTAPGGVAPLQPLARAGIAHLRFETIHPFEDGNGRIGRAIVEKVLAQGLATPAITGVSRALLRHREAYYRQLERASRDLGIGDWLLWFAAKAIEAQRLTLGQVEFVLEKSRLMDRLNGKLNPRQEKAVLRLFDAGLDGFKGGLSAANYMTITGAPTATATRDLGGLVEIGALRRTGERKSTRYYLNMNAQPVQEVTEEHLR